MFRSFHGSLCKKKKNVCKKKKTMDLEKYFHWSKAITDLIPVKV